MSTEQLRLRAAPPRIPFRLPSSTGSVVVLVGGALFIALVTTAATWGYRALFAAVILVNLLIVSVKWPRLGVVLTFIYLPVMALIRRLLIGPSGWTATDPLLVVGPLVALFLVYRVVIAERRPAAQDKLSKYVFVLLGMALIESMNPSGGNGVTAGVLGLLFIAVPLLWFFVGREACTPRMALTLVYLGVAVAAVVAGYGLWQTQIGMPWWDQEWVKVSGYAALHVGEQNPIFGTQDSVIRPFGTFASAREYGSYLDIGLVFAVALALHRRYAALLTVPFLGWAIVLSSGRSILVLGLLGVVFVVGMRTRSATGLIVTFVLGLGVLFAVVGVFGSSLDKAANQSSNPLVSHQAGGLLHPLDPNQSTLLGHTDLLKQGIIDGFKDPIGKGTGVTNRAAGVAGGTNQTSEVDISDAFISMGLIGGIVFFSIIVMAFRRVVSAYFRRGDPALLAAGGLFVVMLGQWLNGGLYAVAPLTWFFVGWAATMALDRPRAKSKPRSGRAGGATR